MDPSASPPEASLLMKAIADSVAGVDDSDAFSTRILDAAGELFSRRGIRRVTMDDVAQAAGVARVTIYRRFAHRDAVIEAVVGREFRRYLEQFFVEIAEADSAGERVVVGFVSSLRAIRGSAVMGGLLRTEPELLVASLLSDEGRTVAMIRGFVAAQLRREQEAGHVPDDLEVDLVAEVMVRLTVSFLFTPSEIVDLADDKALAELARKVLVPMIRPLD